MKKRTTCSGDISCVEIFNSFVTNIDGKGRFEIELTDVLPCQTDAATGDINADELLDVVSGGAELLVHFFEGDEFESNVIDETIETRTSGVSIADIDGDGDLDILAANRVREVDEDRLLWFENLDGRQTFSMGRVISESFNRDWGSVHVADVDGDGDVDVLGHSLSDWLVLHENVDGRGSFESIEFIGSIRPPGFVVDFDGDQDMDLVRGLSWFENRQIGDSNDDNIFNSADLVKVFVAGKYEDGVPNNATFDEGDWNQDGDFDTNDLVFAFQFGNYIAAAKPLKSQIAASVDWLLTVDESVSAMSATDADSDKSFAAWVASTSVSMKI